MFFDWNDNGCTKEDESFQRNFHAPRNDDPNLEQIINDPFSHNDFLERNCLFSHSLKDDFDDIETVSTISTDSNISEFHKYESFSQHYERTVQKVNNRENNTRINNFATQVKDFDASKEDRFEHPLTTNAMTSVFGSDFHFNNTEVNGGMNNDYINNNKQKLSQNMLSAVKSKKKGDSFNSPNNKKRNLDQFEEGDNHNVDPTNPFAKKMISPKRSKKS